MTARDETNIPASLTRDGVVAAVREVVAVSLNQIASDVEFLRERVIRWAPLELRLSEFLDRDGQVGNRVCEGLRVHVIEGSGNPTRDDMRAVVREEIRRAERAAMARLRSSAGPAREDVLGDLADGELELPDDGDHAEQGGTVDEVHAVAPGGSLGEGALEILRAGGFLRDPESVVSEMLGRTHESSPSVDESGDPTVGDGGAAGDTSDSPTAPPPTPDREAAGDDTAALENWIVSFRQQTERVEKLDAAVVRAERSLEQARAHARREADRLRELKRELDRIIHGTAGGAA